MQRKTWRIRQRGFQALAVLLVASGFYLLVDGSYRIASLAVTSINPSTVSIVELLVGSVLIWAGSASVAASRTVVIRTVKG